MTGINRSSSRLLALVVVAGACTGHGPQDQHVARGDTLASQQKIPEAIVEYQQALRTDSKNARATHHLGLAYLRLGQLTQAYDALLKTVSLAPDNLDARLKLATIDLILARKTQARDEAYALLQKDSLNPGALVLLSATIATSDEVDRAIRRFEAAMPGLGKDARAHLALGSLKWRKGDTAAAQTAFDEAVAADPKLVEAHLVLARLYTVRGNSESAESELRTAGEIAAPGSLDRLGPAEGLLIVGQREQAKSVLREVAEKNSNDPFAWRLLANLELSDGSPDEAAKSVSHLPTTDTSDVEAIVLSGRLHLARGEADAATADFQRALKAAPQLAPIHYYLAAALLQSGKGKEAKAELESAVRLAPAYPDAVFQLAELNLQTGAPDAARADVERFIKTNPTSIKAYVVLGAALAATGHAAEATEAFQHILAIAPNSSEGHYWLGMGLVAERRRDEAKAEFQKALDNAPEFREAITQLVLMDLGERAPDIALSRVRRQMAIVPRSADLYDLLGLVHAVRNASDSAEAAFLKSIDLNARLLDSRVRLAELYASTGKTDQSLAQAEAARGIEPTNIRVLMAVGVAAQRKGDTAKARQAYEEALTLQPHFAGAANNLALLFADRGEDATALRLAQRAQEAAPNDPHVGDTLGWILYKRGEFAKAMRTLVESASKLPDSPSVQYHLGMAAQKNGDVALAREALGRAVNSPTPFAEKEEARKALLELK